MLQNIAWDCEKYAKSRRLVSKQGGIQNNKAMLKFVGETSQIILMRF
jgi:hypothetical protein